MKSEKIKIIAYWVATGLTAASYAFGGYAYTTLQPQVVAGMGQLGYPLYFAVMLGVWKFLGAITIVVPRLPLLKEWAYAGMFINLTAAAISIAVVGVKIGDISAPLLNLVLVISSWALRPAGRKLTGESRPNN